MQQSRAHENSGVFSFLKHMRSPRGFWGSLVVLAVVPLTLLYQRVFPDSVSTFTHWVFVIGYVLLALAVFDFPKLPRWVNWLGFLSIAIEAVIFFLQGLSDLLQNDSLTDFAYQVLGQQLEAAMLWVFVLVWGGAMLLRDSWGKTRLLGIIALSLFFVTELLHVILAFTGGSPIELLKIILLLPFVWLLLECSKQKSLEPAKIN